MKEGRKKERKKASKQALAATLWVGGGETTDGKTAPETTAMGQVEESEDLSQDSDSGNENSSQNER